MDRGQIKRRMHGKRKGNCICFVDLFQSLEAMRDIVLFCWEFRKENIVTMCFSGWMNKLKFVGNWHCTIARWVR